MFNIFKKDKEKNKDIDNALLLKTTSLLVHAAKMDENYTEMEKKIIKKAIIELGYSESKINELIRIAEEKEEQSNQILEFTKEIKNSDENFKIKLVETLWKIIYSDNNQDIYESNLMRRLSGLLYLDNKMVGDIKQKIKNNLNK